MDPSFVAAYDDWLQELICFILLVSLLDCGDRIIRTLAFTVDQALDGDLDPLPSFVTVHGIVPADDGDELSDLLLLYEVKELFRVLCGGAGSGVTAIAKEVDEDMWDFELLRSLKERKEVTDVGMNTTIRDLQAAS